MTVKQKEGVVSALKEWASPVLFGLVGMVMWQILNELRTDVKVLLSQRSADNVRITNLEADVAALKQYILQPGTVAYPAPKRNEND
jgi:hypothetical protein